MVRALPALPGGVTVTDIAMTSAASGWAVGTSDQGAVFLRYANGQWSLTGDTFPGVRLAAISMDSPDDGWAAGFSNASAHGMYLAHYDGTAWTRAQGPAALSATDLNAVRMLSAGEGWAGGDMQTTLGSVTVLLRYTGGRWTRLPLTYGGSITSIAMVSATEGWAAVSGGTTAGLLHYHNGQWTPYTPGR